MASSVLQTISTGSLLHTLVLGDVNLQCFGSARVCRPGSISLLLSKQFCMLRTFSVKQGYLSRSMSSSFWMKMVMEEVLSFWSKSGQHSADGYFFPYRRTHSFDDILLDLTQIRVAYIQGRKLSSSSSNMLMVAGRTVKCYQVQRCTDCLYYHSAIYLH